MLNVCNLGKMCKFALENQRRVRLTSTIFFVRA